MLKHALSQILHLTAAELAKIWVTAVHGGNQRLQLVLAV
jgi:hypothetical protein